MNKLRLSYTQIDTYLRCSMKYYYRYVMGIRPKGKAPRLQLGESVHAALEHFYQIPSEKRSSKLLRKHYDLSFNTAKAQAITMQKQAAKEGEWEFALYSYNQELDGEYQRGLTALSDYYLHYEDDPEIPQITTELPGEVDMGDFILVFRLDGIFRRDEDIMLLETKTQNTMDIESLETYDVQTLLYVAALRQAGIPIETVLYNVLGMPPPTGSRSRKRSEFGRLESHRTLAEEAWAVNLASNTAKAILSLKEQRTLPVPSFNKTCAWCEFLPVELVARAGGYLDTLVEEMYTTQTFPQIVEGTEGESDNG